MKRLAAVLGATAALLASPAWAQVYGNELSFFGTMDNVSEPVDYELSVFHVRYGMYLSARSLASVGLSHARFDTGVADSTTTALTVGVKHYFGVQSPATLLPFVEAAIGVARADTGARKDTDLTWEVGGGGAYFMSEATSFDASLRWYQTDTEGSDTEGLRLFLGLTTRF